MLYFWAPCRASLVTSGSRVIRWTWITVELRWRHVWVKPQTGLFRDLRTQSVSVGGCEWTQRGLQAAEICCLLIRPKIPLSLFPLLALTECMCLTLVTASFGRIWTPVFYLFTVLRSIREDLTNTLLLSIDLETTHEASVFAGIIRDDDDSVLFCDLYRVICVLCLGGVISTQLCLLNVLLMCLRYVAYIYFQTLFKVSMKLLWNIAAFIIISFNQKH